MKEKKEKLPKKRFGLFQNDVKHVNLLIFHITLAIYQTDIRLVSFIRQEIL